MRSVILVVFLVNSNLPFQFNKFTTFKTLKNVFDCHEILNINWRDTEVVETNRTSDKRGLNFLKMEFFGHFSPIRFLVFFLF